MSGETIVGTADVGVSTSSKTIVGTTDVGVAVADEVLSLLSGDRSRIFSSVIIPV